MLKINFSAKKAHKSLCVRRAAPQRVGLGLGEGLFFFRTGLFCGLCPSGVRVPVLPQQWGGPNGARSPESSATFHRERGSVKSAVAQGAFAPFPGLFGFAARAKQGLQRLMKEAAGSSHKKRDEKSGVRSLAKQKLRAAQGEWCADASQGMPRGRR